MALGFARRRFVSHSTILGAFFLAGCGPTEEQSSAPGETQGTSLTFSRPGHAFEQVSQFRLGAFAKNQLPVLAGRAVTVTVENLDREGDYLAMNGHAVDSPDSRFILKGNRDELRGFLVLREQNQAYKYKTVNGALTAEEVPVEEIYPVCNLSRPPSASAHNDVEPLQEAPSGMVSFIGTYDGGDLRKLQSRPGAKKVLYLDLTQSMNGDTPKDFSKEEMWKSWAGVAAAYSSFDVNVTTDASVYNAAGMANSGVAKFISTDDRAFCAADAFGTREYCQVFTGDGAEPEKGYGVARSATHELGHLIGMLHDGTASKEYYPGLPAFDWAPIMGDYYSHSGKEALNQWSKGEYSGANNKEDDLAIITRILPYLADDIPDAKPLKITGSSVTSDVNRGQIARSSDSDKFTFKIGQSGGRATLNIARIEYIGGSMLDVDARLLDGSGTELAANNPQAQRGAKIDLALQAGEYSLIIKGGAEGTPSNGFSNYSSIGYYGITGTVTGAVTDMGTGGTGTGGASGTGGAGAGGSNGGAGGSGGKGGAGGGSNGGNAGSQAGGTSAGGSSKGGSSGNSSGGFAGNSSGGSTAAGAGGASGGMSSTSGGAASGGSAGALTGGTSTTTGGAVNQAGMPSVTGGTSATGGTSTTTGGTSAMGTSTATGGANNAGGPITNAGQGPGTTPPADDGGCTCSSAGSQKSHTPAALLCTALAGVVGLRRRRGRVASAPS